MGKKNKKLLILTLFTSLFSVIVGGVSTFAWFQIDQKPIQSEIITGSPNITISDNIYGYKINQTIGNNGYLSSSNDILKFGKDNNVTGTNHHQDTSDTNFNVPNDGIGYYLVKKNPSGSFKYNYTADGTNYTSYSTKFIQYDSTYISRAYIDNFSVSKNDVFRVMKYTFSNNKTVNAQLEINSVYPTDLLSIDSKTTDVTCATAGTYKIWLDYDSGDLSFEKCDIVSNSAKVRSNIKQNHNESQSYSNLIKKSSGTTTNTTYTRLIIDGSSCNWGYRTLWLDNFSFASGYNIDDFAYFVDEYYGDSVDSWDASRTTLGWHRYSNGFNLCSGTSYGSDGDDYMCYILPSWVNYCSVQIESSWGDMNWSGGWRKHGNVYMGYLNNLYYEAGHNGKTAAATSNNMCTTGVGKTITFTAQYWQNFPNYDGSHQYDNWNSIHFGVSVVDNSYSMSWTTNTVTISYVNTSGASISTGSSSNYINVDNYALPSSYPSISGYQSYAIYYSRTNSFSNKTVTSLSTNLQVQDGFTIFLVYNKIYTVNIYGEYYITDIDNNENIASSFEEILHTEDIIEGYTYTASGYTNVRTKTDTANGIYYVFNRPNSSTWYTNAACSSTWTNSSKINANTSIYAKFTTDLDNYTTFYVDITDAYDTNSNVWSSVSIMQTNGAAAFVACAQVATKLYRVTMPSNYEFRLGNGIRGDGTGQNFSTQVLASQSNLPSSHIGKILYVHNCDYGSNHDFFWCSQKSETTYGTATIYTSPTDSSDTSTWTERATMDIGDGQNNYFIYEKGLQIATNTYIHVVVTGDGSVPVEPDYGLSTKLYNLEEPYLDHDGTYVKTCNYTGNARFTFYLTYSQKLVVAMVPDYGNGFYIMNYNQTYGTDNYIGSIKMTSNSDSRASYDYFYATAGEEIFIRSYLNGVDRLIDTSWTLPRDGVYLGTDGTNDTAPGVIHFTNKGYYNITVENGVIEVTALDELSSSFKLNKLDTSNVDSAYKIWKQKTSLVLEVPFTAVNDYESQISLTVSNPLSEFVGVSLCVVPGFSSSKSYAIGNYTVYNDQLYKFTSAHSAGSWNISHVTEVSPYNFMRGEGTYTRSTFYNSLSNSSTITDQMNSRIKSQNNTDYSYAYILVDYLPTQVNEAGYAYSGKALEGNSAYSGSVCTNGIYSDEKFTSSTLLTSTISYYLVATQV